MTAIKLPINATEQDERNYVDFETKKFLNRLKKLNGECKHIQVTDVKIKINHPSPTDYKRWWQFWKK